MKSPLCFAVVMSLFSQSLSTLSADDRPVADLQMLPGTQLLQLEEPLDVVMVRGISQFAEREIQRVSKERTATWLRHPANTVPGTLDRKAARTEFSEIIGLPKDRVENPVLKRIGTGAPGSESVMPVVERDGYEMISCQWDALTGVTGQGLLAIPKPKTPGNEVTSQQPFPLVIYLADASESPEASFGLTAGIPESRQFAHLLAEKGCMVLCPLLIDRRSNWSPRETNLPHRELIYRHAFELGLHPIGFEVAKLLTGIAAVKGEYPAWSFKTVVIGTGEGGLLALAAGAITDTGIDAVSVRGYFNERDHVWEEPIERNLFGQLNRFGDAELASLIAPRPLLIENTDVPVVSGPPTPKGRRLVAAPGKITVPDNKTVQQEFNKAAQYYRQCQAEQAITLLLRSEEKQQDAESLQNLLALIQKVAPQTKFQNEATPGKPVNIANLTRFQQSRMKDQVQELVRYTQRVLADCQSVRQEKWKDLNQKTPAEFAAASGKFRKWVHESFIGVLPRATAPLNARSRKILDEPAFVGYEVVLDLDPTPTPRVEDGTADWGVIAGGVLLLPKDLQAGEKRPVVVFQHGLEGTPQSTFNTDQSTHEWQAYHAASAELVKRGFIVYAPQNPYRGHDHFRVLQRKSNPIGRSLFSYIIEQHRQTLHWLAGLSYVDADHIAFYGISYGGKTAMRVPAVLVPGKGEPGYCLSICSADFNDWIRKNCSENNQYSYVYTPEYEIFEWDMGHVANYAELSWLILPRPFMVERGLDDGVAPDDWVGAEYARVLRRYMKLGLADETRIEVFNGPHCIHGQGTYHFLHEKLNWPEPAAGTPPAK